MIRLLYLSLFIISLISCSESTDTSTVIDGGTVSVGQGLITPDSIPDTLYTEDSDLLIDVNDPYTTYNGVLDSMVLQSIEDVEVIPEPLSTVISDTPDQVLEITAEDLLSVSAEDESMDQLLNKGDSLIVALTIVDNKLKDLTDPLYPEGLPTTDHVEDTLDVMQINPEVRHLFTGDSFSIGSNMIITPDNAPWRLYTDTLHTEYIIYADDDGVLRKEAGITLVKEYESNGWYSRSVVYYWEELVLDVVMLKRVGSYTTEF